MPGCRHRCGGKCAGITFTAAMQGHPSPPAPAHTSDTGTCCGILTAAHLQRAQGHLEILWKINNYEFCMCSTQCLGCVWRTHRLMVPSEPLPPALPPPLITLCFGHPMNIPKHQGSPGSPARPISALQSRGYSWGLVGKGNIFWVSRFSRWWGLWTATWTAKPSVGFTVRAPATPASVQPGQMLIDRNIWVS